MGIPEAERHLLDLVRAGDAGGWRQLVDRYERRLHAFALGRVDQSATAQDLVQETFIGFLGAMNRFRADATLESFLFRILRRRIVDHYRANGQDRVLHACEIGDNQELHGMGQIPSDDLSASQYMRNDEQTDEEQAALCDAIASVTAELREAEKFRDLKIAEGLFYAGLRNRRLADLLGATQSEIGVVKHRLVKKLSDKITLGCLSNGSQSVVVETDLSAAWEDHRPSCLRRATLGRYSLGILPPLWQDFVAFHVETLGCRYCNANLTELRSASVKRPRTDKLFQSTIGFLNR